MSAWLQRVRGTYMRYRKHVCMEEIEAVAQWLKARM